MWQNFHEEILKLLEKSNYSTINFLKKFFSQLEKIIHVTDYFAPTATCRVTVLLKASEFIIMSI